MGLRTSSYRRLASDGFGAPCDEEGCHEGNEKGLHEGHESQGYEKGNEEGDEEVDHCQGEDGQGDGAPGLEAENVRWYFKGRAQEEQERTRGFQEDVRPRQEELRWKRLPEVDESCAGGTKRTWP